MFAVGLIVLLIFGGVGSFETRTTLLEFHPAIKTIKEKISTVYKTSGDSLVSTRLLISKNIANARDLSYRELLKVRQEINEARSETNNLPRARECIFKQELKCGKIQAGNFLKCNGNYTQVNAVRNEIFQLERVSLTLENDCARLNPLQKEGENLRLCLVGKLQDLEVQLLRLERQFSESIKELVASSTFCILEGNGKIRGEIGVIEGAINTCLTQF